MKKLLHFSVLSLFCMLCFLPDVNAQNAVNRSDLVGTWQQCDSTGKALVMDAGVIEYKLITPENFAVLQVRKESGVFMAIFFGTYTVENNVYTEMLDYTTPSMAIAKGGKNMFNISIKNNLLYIKGINNSYNQIWKKAEKL